MAVGLQSNGKQGSPFYAEPADAIRQAALLKVQRRQGRVHCAKSHRHSDPTTLLQWPAAALASGLQRIDSKVIQLLNQSSTLTMYCGLTFLLIVLVL